MSLSFSSRASVLPLSGCCFSGARCGSLGVCFEVFWFFGVWRGGLEVFRSSLVFGVRVRVRVVVGGEVGLSAPQSALGVLALAVVAVALVSFVVGRFVVCRWSFRRLSLHSRESRRRKVVSFRSIPPRWTRPRYISFRPLRGGNLRPAGDVPRRVEPGTELLRLLNCQVVLALWNPSQKPTIQHQARPPIMSDSERERTKHPPERLAQLTFCSALCRCVAAI